MMSDLDNWWNAPREAKALTEDDLRQALEACLNTPMRPEPRYVRDEHGRFYIQDEQERRMIVAFSELQEEESQ